MILEESFDIMLHADCEYNQWHKRCREKWETLRKLRENPTQDDNTIGHRADALREYDRLCELREARYMAIKREWEAGQ